MKVLSFKAWIESNPELVKKLKDDAEKIDECPYCDGFGEHECDCGDVHDCIHCEGTGKEDGGGIPVQTELRRIYEHQKTLEFKQLVAWGNVIQVEELDTPPEQGLVKE